MKSLISIISALLGERTSRYNLLALLKLLLVLLGLITIYSVVFHVLMEREGQHHSWITGFYWTLTVMSTFGFGDITFESDAGRLFSIVVLVTGVMFLLVLLPFAFIDAYNEVFGKHETGTRRKVVIAGGGRVGRATSRALTGAGIPWIIIEKRADRVRNIEHAIVGDASEFDVLVQAGLHDAASVIITTHDDDINIFLTIFYRRLRYRRLRNTMQIISHCTHEKNALRLHRAGADLTLSYASMGANTIYFRCTV